MVYKYRGGKLRRWDKLSPEAQQDLLYDLLYAFSLLKNFDDAAQFITDLLTRDEVRFLSKRLRIAKLLLLGENYREIEAVLKVSHATIAKVSAWLGEKGEGFRKIIMKIPTRKRAKHWAEKGGFMKSHPSSFWPQLMSERLEQKAIRNRDLKLRGVLGSLDSKDVLLHRLQETYENVSRTQKD